MKQFRYKAVNFKNIEENSLQSSILRTLAYFDIFEYPLLADEIFEYSDFKDTDFMSLKAELEWLVSDGQIRKAGQYYFFGHESCVWKREEANAYSEKLMKKALKYANLISRFPFVESISISGSLSKKSADANADVDYFIITKENRLWICRMLLVMFKKVFLLNSHKYFCINYFVDAANLEIKEKNIYTATEIAFLIPVYNYENFFRFLSSNNWAMAYYPRKRVEVNTIADRDPEVFLKRAIEFLLNNKTGDFIDNVCLKVNVLYKKLKFGYKANGQLENNLRSTKGVSKHHPNSFQEKVLKQYKEKLLQLKSISNLELN